MFQDNREAEIEACFRHDAAYPLWIVRLRDAGAMRAMLRVRRARSCVSPNFR